MSLRDGIPLSQITQTRSKSVKEQGPDLQRLSLIYKCLPQMIQRCNRTRVMLSKQLLHPLPNVNGKSFGVVPFPQASIDLYHALH